MMWSCGVWWLQPFLETVFQRDSPGGQVVEDWVQAFTAPQYNVWDICKPPASVPSRVRIHGQEWSHGEKNWKLDTQQLR